jgi:hypothetical protein
LPYIKYRLKLFEKLFEKGVLRRIFGPKRNKVTAERRKLHIEELLDHEYYSGD